MKQRTFIALSLWLQAVAQTIGSLPEKGVALLSNEPTGSPVLVNHSGKSVVGTVFAKNGQVFATLYTAPRSQPIQNGGRRQLRSTASRLNVRSQNDAPQITPAELDLVIFADGRTISPNVWNQRATIEKRLRVGAGN